MILIKKDYEIDRMRKAGRILAETLLVVEENVRPIARKTKKKEKKDSDD